MWPRQPADGAAWVFVRAESAPAGAPPAQLGTLGRHRRVMASSSKDGEHQLPRDPETVSHARKPRREGGIQAPRTRQRLGQRVECSCRKVCCGRLVEPLLEHVASVLGRRPARTGGGSARRRSAVRFEPGRRSRRAAGVAPPRRRVREPAPAAATSAAGAATSVARVASGPRNRARRPDGASRPAAPADRRCRLATAARRAPAVRRAPAEATGRAVRATGRAVRRPVRLSRG